MPNESFLKPGPIERFFNRVFGFAVGLGLAPRYNYLLEVRGRKSGRTFTTPINLLDYQGRRYLVSSRGETQWVRNTRAARRLRLRRGISRVEYEAREISDVDKPVLLMEFLGRHAMAVQRFYSIPKGSPQSEFVKIAPTMPVFELIPAGPRS